MQILSATGVGNQVSLVSELIVQAMQVGALKFGEFTLKSGRESPYFLNAGMLNDGESIDLLARAYADAIVKSDISFDVLFGPAYKAIGLVYAIAACLYRDYKISVGVAYNRKEAKDHGEGGSMVGASVKGKRVLIIDDVATAGTAARESVGIITVAGDANTLIVGFMVMFDRQERGTTIDRSALREIEAEYGFPAVSIFTLKGLMFHLASVALDENANADEKMAADRHLDAICAYRDRWGVETS